MTIKQVLAAFGITNMDSEVPNIENTPQQENTPATKQQENTPATKSENTPPEKPENTPPTQENSSSNELARIAQLEKELKDVKAANAALLAQTPIQKEYTAQDALLELLGIGGNENGNESQ